MLNVALTGNIASGKSAVASVWRRLGARVIEADDLSRRAVAPGSEALGHIVERWGPGMVLPTGELDRAALRDIVFRNAEARERLEEIVHPVVARMRAEEMARAAEAGEDVVVSDIPLLFEKGMEGDFDVVVLVDAPEEERFRRLVELRGLGPAEARRMIAAQLPSEEKRDRADVVIDNDGTLTELEQRAADVWARLTARARASRS